MLLPSLSLDVYTGAAVASFEISEEDSAVTSYSVNKPAGTQEGDILIWFGIFARGGVWGTTAPSGFTAIDGAANGGIGGQWGWKEAGASEPSSYSWSITGGAAPAATLMLRISNANSSPTIGS